MKFLVLRLEEMLGLTLSDEFPASAEDISFDQMSYRLISAGNIFEWLFGDTGDVVGVQLCISTDHELFKNNGYLFRLAYVKFVGGFLRIMFGNNQSGSDRTYQDWEDYYYRGDNGKLLVALATHLLTSQELDTLSLFCQ